MSKSERVSDILKLLAEYNRHQYEYGKAYRNYGTDHLLRHDQVHMINHIGQNPDCNLRYLADTIGLGLPTVSLQVNRLIQMGLVMKRRSDVSQRELEINLTGDGWKIYQFHKQLDDDYIAITTSNMDSMFSDEDIDVIHRFVEKVMLENPV